MSMEEAIGVVVEVVERLQGCKAIELICDEKIVKADFPETVPDVLNEAVRQKRIVEIEYVLPGAMSFRIKSFFLPAGTRIHGSK